MPIVPIASLDDPRLDVYRDLPTARAERRAGLFIAEGMWLVRRLLASRFTTLSLLVDRRRLAEIGTPIPDEVDVFLVPDGFAEQVVGFNFHRGIVACGRRQTVGRVHDLADLGERPWTIVVCSDIQDPENVGAILRNSAAFGARAVILGPKCSDPFSRRVLRVAMGAPFQLEVVQSEDLATDVKDLSRRYDAAIAATVLDERAVPLDSFQRPPRLLLVFGSEGFGLSRDWWTLADYLLTIPMSPSADSLNVAVASGVFLYSLTR